jgi:hypothetical protein
MSKSTRFSGGWNMAELVLCIQEEELYEVLSGLMDHSEAWAVCALMGRRDMEALLAEARTGQER